MAATHALDRHLALVGFMGAGKSTLGVQVAERIGRSFFDLDREIELGAGATVPEIFQRRGEAEFRELEKVAALELLAANRPAVVALGGGAVKSRAIRAALGEHALTVHVEVDPGVAWRRVGGNGRPLAQDEDSFRALYEERQELYREAADAVGRTADELVLAAAGVHVGLGVLERLGELVPGDGPVALVADSHVAGIHGMDAQLALGSRLQTTHEVQVKSVDDLDRLWRSFRLERSAAVVALGGGTTTDLAGFAAATYMRGIDWVPVPTTLVGQVDAAIGGKTGVDLAEGKNLVGAFHWPSRVVIDPALLETLPEVEAAQGRAELVKTSLLAGRELDVRGAAAFKTAVCLADPHERGRRAILNLGHTFAHALEAASGYRLRHGDAVALGLLAALRLSGNEAGLATVRRELDPKPVTVDRERAWAALQRDKKRAAGRVRLVLLPRNGEPEHGVALPEDDVRRALDELIAG